MSNTNNQNNQNVAAGQATQAQQLQAQQFQQLQQQQLQQQAQQIQQQKQSVANMARGTPTPSDLNKVVFDYLNKAGYSRKDTLERLESEHTNTPPVSASNKRQDPVLNHYPTNLNSYFTSAENFEKLNTSGPVSGPKYLPHEDNQPQQTKMQQIYNTHDRPYLALRDWTEKSLDLYKPELRRVLYPVFVHLYLDMIAKGAIKQAKNFFEDNASDHVTLHSQDLLILSSITLPSHLEENEFVKAFRSNKYVLKVSRTTFDLLLYFLHEIEDTGGSAIIRIINQYIEAKITTARPSRFTAEYILDPEEGIPGLLTSGTDSSNNSNNNNTDVPSSLDQFQPLKLGKMPLDPEFSADVEMELNSDQTASTKQEKKVLIKEFHRMHSQDPDSPSRLSLPLPKHKTSDIMAEVQAVKDSVHKISIGATIQTALPSVCMYTFHNTHDDMNNLTFSNDSTLVAAGFQDSFIKIWSLKGKRLQSVLKDDEQNYFPNNIDASDTSVLSRRLVGHAGPVYGLSFSPDNRYLLSSSEDKTVRLWSMDTYTGLVSYKGHGGPVWDVAFGPLGHYFATASHDQTARLWSCDHIYPLRIFAGHISDVDTVSFHPNSLYVVTGSSDKTCRLWDASKGSSARVFIGHTAPITATCISPDGRWLASAADDSSINVWDLGSGRILKTMRGHGKSSIYSLAFSREGSVLVSAGADCTVRVWDIRRGTGDQNPEPIEVYNDPSITGLPDSKGADGKDGSQKSPNGGTGNSSTGASGSGDVLSEFDGRKRREMPVTKDHLAVFNTKRTPVYKVHFTSRNLCIAGGAFMG